MTDLSKLTIAQSPHIRAEDSTRQIMLDVVIALMPALAISIFVFGWRSLSMTLVSVVGCVVFEALYQLIARRPVAVDDLSAVVTGILMAFTLPVAVPIWVVLLGDAFAIIIVKQLYGGLGRNFMNPALAGRAFLVVCFPAMLGAFTKIRTTLPLFATPDAITAATPLVALKGGMLSGIPLTDMALGMVGGSLGETSALALLAGGLYLLYRRVISWRIPVTFLGTVALITYLYPRVGEPLQFMSEHLLSGGLVLGALFMATDYATSPATRTGQLLYGVGCGLLTVLFRYFGALPEGVCFAILIMNACSFLLEKLTAPRVFGKPWPLGLKLPRPTFKRGGDAR